MYEVCAYPSRSLRSAHPPLVLLTGPKVTRGASNRRQPFEHKFAHPGSIGLALGRLHDRADESTGRGDLAVTHLLSHVRVGGDGGVDRLPQRPVVRHDRETAGSHHCVGITLAGHHGVEHLARELVVQRAGVDQCDDAGDVGRCDRQFADLDAPLVGLPRKFTHPPLEGVTSRDAEGNGRFDRVHRARVQRRLHVEHRDAPLVTQAPAPIERIPLDVRAGSILPLGPAIEYAGQAADPIELRVYPGADGSFNLYEDEGDSYRYTDGAYTTIPICWDDAARTLTFGPRQGSYKGMAAGHTFNVVIVGSGHGVGGDPTAAPDKTVVYTGEKVAEKF